MGVADLKGDSERDRQEKAYQKTSMQEGQK
ncbi:cytochrome c-type biogenesis protein CcmE [Pasteurella multocida subsp. multocida str. Anand1_cattle]|nr:cytochrome c-type biogenesis protein CcmE [Pasteurella multocida subsp. multocida str. Anand1_cattle]